jgi:signal transduction histidine kinase
LIGDVAHELRTPLAGIKGSMEGLIDGVLPAAADSLPNL